MNIINPQSEDHMSRPQVEHLEKEKHEIKHLGTMRHRPGHTLFAFNRVTKQIKCVKLTLHAELDPNGMIKPKRCVTIEKDCYYAEALNERNFIRHLKKHAIE